MDITLLYFDDCLGWTIARDRLLAAARLLGIDETTIAYKKIETLRQAQQWGFTGSPTVLVDGKDPFAPGDAVPALACRVYQSGAGGDQAPSIEELVAALRR